MRNTVAKHLNRTALGEMMGDGVPKRDLVMGKNSVVNHPKSVRAMYIRLKQAYKNLRSMVNEAAARAIAKGIALPAAQAPRTRKRSTFFRRQDLTQKPAVIQAPLQMIRALFPDTRNERGEFEASPIYRKARNAARRGDGKAVTAIARQYI